MSANSGTLAQRLSDGLRPPLDASAAESTKPPESLRLRPTSATASTSLSANPVAAGSVPLGEGSRSQASAGGLRARHSYDVSNLRDVFARVSAAPGRFQ
jgi:hypothetical protein